MAGIKYGIKSIEKFSKGTMRIEFECDGLYMTLNFSKKDTEILRKMLCDTDSDTDSDTGSDTDDNKVCKCKSDSKSNKVVELGSSGQAPSKCKDGA